jgi:hypothetical protein
MKLSEMTDEQLWRKRDKIDLLLKEREQDRKAMLSNRMGVEYYNTAMSLIAGMMDFGEIPCPKCGTISKDHKYVNLSATKTKSYFICTECHQSFDHSSFVINPTLLKVHISSPSAAHYSKQVDPGIRNF